jgi:hypothetical protein
MLADGKVAHHGLLPPGINHFLQLFAYIGGKREALWAACKKQTPIMTGTSQIDQPKNAEWNNELVPAHSFCISTFMDSMVFTLIVVLDTAMFSPSRFSVW